MFTELPKSITTVLIINETCSLMFKLRNNSGVLVCNSEAFLDFFFKDLFDFKTPWSLIIFQTSIFF